MHFEGGLCARKMNSIFQQSHLSILELLCIYVRGGRLNGIQTAATTMLIKRTRKAIVFQSFFSAYFYTKSVLMIAIRHSCIQWTFSVLTVCGVSSNYIVQKATFKPTCFLIHFKTVNYCMSSQRRTTKKQKRWVEISRKSFVNRPRQSQ